MTSHSAKSLSAPNEKLIKLKIRDLDSAGKKPYIPQNMEVIFVYCFLPENLKDKLKERVGKGQTLIFVDEQEKNLHPEFHHTTVLFGNPPREWMNSAQNLKFWQLDSAGFAIYSDYATKARVCNMGNFFSRPCAETLIGSLLAFYRKINVFIGSRSQKQWFGKEIRLQQRLLSGRKVVFLGSGNIARETAQLLKAFNCEVKFLAKTNPEAHYRDKNTLLSHLHEFDLIINTLPGTAINYVDAAFFEKMKPGAVYANIGRGITNDEEALLHHIKSGKLAGAILDVNKIEPLPADNPLWNQENIILTHHNGGGIYVEFEAKLNLFLDNLQAYLKGLPLKNLVKLERGY